MTIVEIDPNGKRSAEPGCKLDSGKIRMSLLKHFSRALIEVGKVSTVGAEKYTGGGWLHVENGEQRYADAAWRHLFALTDIDNGVGGTYCLHEAQVIWNLLAALELKLRRKQSMEKQKC